MNKESQLIWEAYINERRGSYADWDKMYGDDSDDAFDAMRDFGGDIDAARSSRQDNDTSNDEPFDKKEKTTKQLDTYNTDEWNNMSTEEQSKAIMNDDAIKPLFRKLFAFMHDESTKSEITKNRSRDDIENAILKMTIFLERPDAKDFISFIYYS